MNNQQNNQHLLFSIQKLIDNTFTQLDLLHTVLSNIRLHKDKPDFEKYTTFKTRKFNDHTKSILSSIGFKRNVHDFQEFYTFNNDFETLDLFLKVLEKKRNFIQKQKNLQLRVLDQIKNEKKQKEIIHNQLMQERLVRTKYGGWLT